MLLGFPRLVLELFFDVQIDRVPERLGTLNIFLRKNPAPDQQISAFFYYDINKLFF